MIDWLLVDAIVRLVGNFAMSIPMIAGGILWVSIGTENGQKFAIRLGAMGLAWGIYNLITGGVYLYTTVTGEFSIFSIPAGLFYSIPNTISNWFPAVFFAGSLGWWGARVKQEYREMK